MVFSWKESIKRDVKKMKARRQVYLKNGEVKKAKDMERRIERHGV